MRQQLLAPQRTIFEQVNDGWYGNESAFGAVKPQVYVLWFGAIPKLCDGQDGLLGPLVLAAKLHQKVGNIGELARTPNLPCRVRVVVLLPAFVVVTNEYFYGRG